MAALTWLRETMREFFHKGDMLLLSLCVAASIYGLVLIYSATRYLGGYSNVIIQGVAILLGIAVYIALSSADVELFTARAWRWLVGFNLLLNALLLTPLGYEAGGNRSWLHVPNFPINLQPAELAKLSFILLLAWQITRLRERGLNKPTSLFQLVGHTVFMFLYISLLSGDFGMGLTYLLIFVVMVWAGGLRKRWFLLALVAAGLGVAFLLSYFGDMYFAKRILVVFDHLRGNADTLVEQTQGVGWQQTRSVLAIGSGGLTGMGYLNGIQTQSPYAASLPARYTDEIFAVCGEEFGLVGCMVLLLLLGAIILRCIWNATRAASPFSALVSVGFAGMLLVQVAVNMGMCLYIFPVVGLTLPFVSYGGTSVVTMFAAMGMVSSIKMRSLPSWLRDRNSGL